MKETIQNFTGLFGGCPVSWSTALTGLISLPRGSALQKRVRDREKEAESDERDRKREKEELEEIRQRLLAEGHPDPDAELQRVGLLPSAVSTSAVSTSFVSTSFISRGLDRDPHLTRFRLFQTCNLTFNNNNRFIYL